MKRCADCGSVKAPDDFPADRARPDGRYPYCRDCQRVRVAAARERRIDHYRSVARRYGREHREQRAAATERWRASNPGAHAESDRRWYAANARRETARAAARRGLLATAEDREYAAVLRADPCSYCGGCGGTIDHVTALACGGDGGWANLTAACASCNSRKGTQPLLLFVRAPHRGNNNHLVTAK